ncbi:cobyrinic acid a,c-diamide synthase [Deferribacterales bacterium RsTz2092]
MPDNDRSACFFDEAADAVERHIDLNALMGDTKLQVDGVPAVQAEQKPDKKAYVAKDAAFSFYYQTTFDLLESSGYEINYFSPLKDESFDDADLVLLGGGYPELYPLKLEAAKGTRNALVKQASSGVPIFAECGGFMYLAKSLEVAGKSYKMAGLLDVDIALTGQRQSLGYVEMDEGLLNARAHSFHYSKVTRCGEQDIYNARSISNGERSLSACRRGSIYGGWSHYMPYRRSDLLMKFAEKQL